MAKSRLAAKLKGAVAERACDCCEYCRSQAKFSPDSFSIEHIVPRASGGSTEMTNLALSCQGCNNRKYISVDALDPVSGRTVALYNPRRQQWTDHFTWSDDFTMMVGITPTGRATVDKLQLNREGVVNLRRVLFLADEHPPQP